MGNNLSVLETFFEDIFSNLFGSNSTNSTVAEEEESEFVKDLNITPNQNLDDVNTAASGFNSDMSTKQTSINTQLQEINYYDNSIKRNNELLQLIANTSNKQLQDLYRKEFEIATKSSLVNNLNKSKERANSCNQPAILYLYFDSNKDVYKPFEKER